MSFSMVFLPPQSARTKALANEVAEAIAGVTIHLPADLSEAESAISEADAAYGTLPVGLLRQARSLSWLQAPQAAPPAGYYYPELVDHSVVITNFRGIFATVVPGHILAFMLYFARGLHHYLRHQQEGHWHQLPDEAHTNLNETTVLMVGMGSIGRETGRLCASFGMAVIGVDSRNTEPSEGVDEISSPAKLDELLPRADFVVVTVPHTPQTEGLFDSSRFRMMKRSAYFINVGRGKTVRLDDLTAALARGDIAGAALDVFEVEPLPRAHPLWRAGNVVITPHVASSGVDLEPLRTELVVENARRFAAGLPLLNVVDKANWF